MNKYEIEDCFATDNFKITIDDVFEIECINFPSDLAFDSDKTEELFELEFKNFMNLN